MVELHLIRSERNVGQGAKKLFESYGSETVDE